jgi:hypothetical protein
MATAFRLQTGSLRFQMWVSDRVAIRVSLGIVGGSLGCGRPARACLWACTVGGPNGNGDTHTRALTRGWFWGHGLAVLYLVDPASSHMLVPKTKPCMSELKP